jgi:fumarylpyruvate hydrolase
VDKAMGLVYGYSIGVDMTRRDLQAEAKDKRRPWEAGKTFAQAAPLADLLPISETGEINAAEIQLVINGEVRQQGNVNQMIWKVSEIISRLSEMFLLQAGDLIFTGTPAGVGPVEIGDEVNATLTGLPELNFKVV